MPKVSVIIPVFNGERYIGEAIESVLSQTYKDFELIVIDDGSTDRTPEVVASYSPVRYVRQDRNAESGGQGQARNRGIREAVGEYIAFLDCDDVWYPDKLAYQVPVLEQSQEIGLVYCDQERIDAQGKSLGIDRMSNWRKGYAKEFFGGHNVANSTMVVRKVCLERVGCYDELMTACSDKDLFVRLFDNCKFVGVGKVLIKKRRHALPFSKRHEFESAALEGQRRLQVKLAGRSLTPAQETFLLHECALYYYACGNNRSSQGQRRLAQKYYVHAIKTNPWLFKAYGRLIRSTIGI